MMRSGSTVQFQIAARLVEEAGLGQRVEWVKPERFPELRQKYADYQGWKVFKNHTSTAEMISEFHQQNAMGVYVFRDLRDVFFSTMKKYSMPFDQLWASGFLDEVLHHFHRWTILPRVLVSKYEVMITDLPAEVERIADHLGIPCDHQKYEQIALDYTIEKQKERIATAKSKGELQGGFADDEFDPYTLLHTNHISSGEIEGWKDVFSAAQVALIEDRAQEWLVTNGYELTLSSAERNRLKLRYKLSPKTNLRIARRISSKVLARLRS